METPITIIEKLDTLLIIIASELLKSTGDIQFILKNSYGCDLSIEEIRRIARKLDKDEYVYFDRSVDTCRISVDGEVFLSQGGYQAKDLRNANDALWKQSEITRQRDLDTLLATNSSRLNELNYYLAIGTIAAAVVGLAILIFQWYAYLHPIAPPK